MNNWLFQSFNLFTWQLWHLPVDQTLLYLCLEGGAQTNDWAHKMHT